MRWLPTQMQLSLKGRGLLNAASPLKKLVPCFGSGNGTNRVAVIVWPWCAAGNSSSSWSCLASWNHKGKRTRPRRCPIRKPGGEHPMDRLHLAMLGPPEVFHNGSRLSFALRKALGLLVYLAVEGGMHPRGKLAALLWPDSEPHAARTALRNALALLRSLLADSDSAPAQHTHLLSERELVGLNPQAALELDLAVVRQAYTAAQRFATPPAEQQRAALVTPLQQALFLVRGPFLDGFWRGEDAPFDVGVKQERQQWQVRVQLLCEGLSSWQGAAGAVEQTRTTPSHRLALAPR